MTALSELKPVQESRLAKAIRQNASRLDQLWLMPWKLMRSPDAWQERVMQQAITRMESVILCCSRQVGKTEVVAAIAYLAACYGWFVLVVSPSDEQSKEFMARMLEYHGENQLVNLVGEPTKHELLLRGGGRVLARPNNERTIRVYSKVDLLIIDEAARVPDQLYGAVRPMLAVSGGRTILLSTPFGQRGFFHDEWVGEGQTDWRRHKVKWNQCDRIPKSWIEQERRSRGDIWVKQEYECEFLSTSGACPFDIEAMMNLERVECEVEY